MPVMLSARSSGEIGWLERGRSVEGDSGCLR